MITDIFITIIKYLFYDDICKIRLLSRNINELCKNNKFILNNNKKINFLTKNNIIELLFKNIKLNIKFDDIIEQFDYCDKYENINIIQNNFVCLLKKYESHEILYTKKLNLIISYKLIDVYFNHLVLFFCKEKIFQVIYSDLFDFFDFMKKDKLKIDKSCNKNIYFFSHNFITNFLIYILDNDLDEYCCIANYIITSDYLKIYWDVNFDALYCYLKNNQDKIFTIFRNKYFDYEKLVKYHGKISEFYYNVCFGRKNNISDKFIDIGENIALKNKNRYFNKNYEILYYNNFIREFNCEKCKHKKLKKNKFRSIFLSNTKYYNEIIKYKQNYFIKNEWI